MPDASIAERAQALRACANQHPTVATLKTQLDQYPEKGSPEDGLYVEGTDTAGLVVNGELRVSILRVYTQQGPTRRLIGQLQAVRTIDHPLQTWQLRFFVHEPDRFATEQFENEQAWFVRVLDLHYERSQARPTLTPPVPA